MCGVEGGNLHEPVTFLMYQEQSVGEGKDRQSAQILKQLSRAEIAIERFS